MVEFFYAALASPRGIVLATQDPQALTQQLHKARREHGDPTLSSIIIARSRTDPAGEVWLIKKDAPSAPQD